jgi:hypothetical protein
VPADEALDKIPIQPERGLLCDLVRGMAQPSRDLDRIARIE